MQFLLSFVWLFFFLTSSYLAVIRIEELLRDIDSEEEEPSNVKERRILTAKRRKGHQTWLKEESEDITDFMDTGAAKKVTGKKQKT